MALHQATLLACRKGNILDPAQLLTHFSLQDSDKSPWIRAANPKRDTMLSRAVLKFPIKKDLTFYLQILQFAESTALACSESAAFKQSPCSLQAAVRTFLLTRELNLTDNLCSRLPGRLPKTLSNLQAFPVQYNCPCFYLS